MSFRFNFISFLLLLLPESVFAAVSEIFSLSPTISERISEWRAALDMIPEKLFFGYGFAMEIPPLNAFVIILLRFGVFVFAISVLLLLLRLVQFSEYRIYTAGSLVALISEAGVLCLFGLISLGMTMDVFSDITVYFLFVAIFGILSATLRISKSEHDERMSYYGDQRSHDSSDVSIRLQK